MSSHCHSYCIEAYPMALYCRKLEMGWRFQDQSSQWRENLRGQSQIPATIARAIPESASQTRLWATIKSLPSPPSQVSTNRSDMSSWAAELPTVVPPILSSKRLRIGSFWISIIRDLGFQEVLRRLRSNFVKVALHSASDSAWKCPAFVRQVPRHDLLSKIRSSQFQKLVKQGNDAPQKHVTTRMSFLMIWKGQTKQRD